MARGDCWWQKASVRLDASFTGSLRVLLVHQLFSPEQAMREKGERATVAFYDIVSEVTQLLLRFIG